MKKMILKTDEIMKVGDEVFTGGMKKIVQGNNKKDNVVVIALIITIGTAFVVHDLITNGYGADIEIENKKVAVSFQPRVSYSQAV
ncbi:hypothetical protein DSECCO2_638940 [anaerobic digester metagenome]